MNGRGLTVPALLVTVVAGVSGPVEARGQTVTERSPNLDGAWTPPSGTLQFNFVHRFRVTEAPTRKVLNSPTFVLATGAGSRAALGMRYGSNSALVPGEPNELELFGRWSPLRSEGDGPTLAVQAAWNHTAQSGDAEALVGWTRGRLGISLVGRAFTAFAGEEGELAAGGAARWRLSRHAALAADAVRLVTGDEHDTAWGAALQVAVPSTPHTLSVHVTDAATTTLQGSSVGVGERRWGFEFTVPVTLSRYFGGGPRDAPGGEDEGPAGAPGVEAADHVVEMDDRLRFLPDTLRIRVGETVLWRNTSSLDHTVTADPALAADTAWVRLPEGADPFHSGTLRPGETFVRRFEVPGIYRYVCLPHQPRMFGTVVVERE